VYCCCCCCCWLLAPPRECPCKLICCQQQHDCVAARVHCPAAPQNHQHMDGSRNHHCWPVPDLAGLPPLLLDWPQLHLMPHCWHQQSWMDTVLPEPFTESLSDSEGDCSSSSESSLIQNTSDGPSEYLAKVPALTAQHAASRASGSSEASGMSALLRSGCCCCLLSLTTRQTRHREQGCPSPGLAVSL
jgi:hypothetical protein